MRRMRVLTVAIIGLILVGVTAGVMHMAMDSIAQTCLYEIRPSDGAIRERRSISIFGSEIAYYLERPYSSRITQLLAEEPMPAFAANRWQPIGYRSYNRHGVQLSYFFPHGGADFRDESPIPTENLARVAPFVSDLHNRIRFDIIANSDAELSARFALLLGEMLRDPSAGNCEVVLKEWERRRSLGPPQPGRGWDPHCRFVGCP